MAIIIVSQKPGPLSPSPISVPFVAPSNGPFALMVSGSVWTRTANTMIGIQINLDGQALGSAQIFANTANTHMNVVPAAFAVKLSQGSHTVQLSPATSATASDENDFYTVVLEELG
jgi:hypothetical protein